MNSNSTSNFWCGFLFLCTVLLSQISFAQAQGKNLEIHYINVGQGMSVLIIGPNGKTILYDFGNHSASQRLIPYLQSIGITADRGLDLTILSHYDIDHYRGYVGLIAEGYDIKEANFGPFLPPHSASMLRSHWINPAKETSAGEIQTIKYNQSINLSSGAEVKVVAANGKLFNGKQFNVKNSNDKSIALFISYDNFQMILDGDIGGGKEECTGIGTKQVAMQSRIAEALIENGLVDPAIGIEVINVAHHGSHSSTTAAYFSLMNPQVAIINVGNPNKKYQHPRTAVVEKVLLQQHKNCGDSLTVDPAVIFRTDNGTKECDKRQSSPDECSSDSGIRCGDIKITTDGKKIYTVSCSGRVWNGKQKAHVDPIDKKTFIFDEVSEST